MHQIASDSSLGWLGFSGSSPEDAQTLITTSDRAVRAVVVWGGNAMSCEPVLGSLQLLQDVHCTMSGMGMTPKAFDGCGTRYYRPVVSFTLHLERKYETLLCGTRKLMTRCVTPALPAAESGARARRRAMMQTHTVCLSQSTAHDWSP